MISNRITKGQVAEFVKAKLSTDEKWAKRALLSIYAYQTADEQSMRTTNRWNGVGFSGCDADILSSFAEQLQRRGTLSHKQMAIVFKKMKKYSRQIIQISDAEKLESLVRASRK